MNRPAVQPETGLPVILFLDQSSELGGGQRMLLDLLPAIEGSFTPVVGLPGPGPFTAELQRRGVRWELLAVGTYRSGVKPKADLLRYALRQPALAARLGQLAKATAAALIYANGPRVFASSAWVARRLELPLIWHLHLELRLARDRQLVSAAARLARPAIIACSRACLTPFPARGIVRRSAEVIYNGVAPVEGHSVQAIESSRLRYAQRAPVIGVVGRLHPDKGQADLLRSAPEVLRVFPGARFCFLGAVEDESYARQLRQQAAALGSKHVEFLAPVGEPAAALAGLDLLVVPSHREAFGRVIIEAFSAGIPVVAADAGGIPEVIEAGRNGLLFRCGDEHDLARALIRVLGDEHLRGTLIAGGRESYQARWRVERFQNEVLRRIASQIESRTSRRSTPAQ